MNHADRKYLLENSTFNESAIPFSTHPTREVVSTREGDRVTVLRLDGIPFQTSDIGDVNIAHETLNIVLRNIASPHLTVWTYTIRDEEQTYVQGEFRTTFAKSLDAKYRNSVSGARLMSNSLYIALVYRPILDRTERAVLERAGRSAAATEELRQINAAALEKLADIVRLMSRMMSRYSPRQLTTYTHGGILYSEALEFFSFLINGFWRRVPVLPAEIATYISTSRPLWGTDTYEQRGVVESKFGAMLAFQAYPANTNPGLLNEFLTHPMSFILTQSYQFMDRTGALEKLQLERRRLDGSGELVARQVEEIDDQIEMLNGGDVVFGAHHLSLNVFARNADALKNSLGLAESALGATGCTVAREDEGMVESYWAQLPGNFKQRPRLSVINSRNFAGLASFHNFPSGRKHGNQWGDAIVMLRTTAGTPFFFNFHLTKAHTAKLVRNSAQLDYAVPTVPANEDGTDSLDARKAVSAVYAKLALEEVETLRDTEVEDEFLEDDLPFVNETRVQQQAIENPFALKPMAAAVQKAVKKMVADLGNTIVIGPPGSGKTVMQGALATFATKVPGMRIAVFDKDQGMELQVVANGGSYLRLKANRPSGIAPLQLEKNEANVGLNVRLVKKLCTSNGYVLTAPESEQISYAVNQVMERDRSKRRLRAVYDLMPSDSTTGARAQLKKWVYTGENAWLFDNDVDEIALDASIVGFDITDFLELPEVRSPLLMYIAHRVRHEMVRGNPFIWVWDEFWKSLADPEMEYIAKDELKTIRKKGGLLVMGTQEAEDVVNSSIASTIIQATATMILCPNPKADRKAYIEGLKLTEAEFLLVRQGMMPGSNRYLIKQGASSVVVELDLGDPSFANELSILSGTAANIGVYDELVAQLGTKNPDKWLPIFYERRK